MEELNIKIEELERKIGILELDVKKLLNYGNVPDRNWAEAFDIMLTRERLKSALDELKDVKGAIKQYNDTARNLRYIHKLKTDDMSNSKNTKEKDTVESAVDAIVICPLCNEPCDFDAHENEYFWAECNTCNTYASALSIVVLKQRLARMGK